MDQEYTVAEGAEWLDRLFDPTHTIHVALFHYERVTKRFRMPNDRVIPEHLLYFVVDGVFDGSVLGQEVHLTPGSMFFAPPGVPHTFWIYDPAPITFSFRFRLLDGEGRDVHFGSKPIVLDDIGSARPILEQLFREYTEAWMHHEHRFRALLSLLSIEILRRSEQAGAPERQFSASQRRRILDRVQRDSRRLPTRAELAVELGLSPVYFARLFTRSFGCPPKTWLKRERIRRAALLLMETDMTVTEIAERLEYRDVYLFSRQFKEEMGRSPSEYRRNH